MGVRRGGQGGLLPPSGRPSPAKNSMFLDFFAKNSIFLLLFRQKVGSCAPLPLENFCPPLEKSLRTPMYWLYKLPKHSYLNLEDILTIRDTFPTSLEGRGAIQWCVFFIFGTKFFKY